MPDALPSAGPYPAGHLERLDRGALIAELGRQREAEDEALLASDRDAAEIAAARARAAQAEIIRRGLIAMGATEANP